MSIKRKCRAICPWSKTASPFADDWTKLCNRIEQHGGMHQSVNGARWDTLNFQEPSGLIHQIGYSDNKRVVLS